MVPVVVQLIAWVAPTIQASPPFGAVRTRPPRILKLASETSLAEGSAGAETRTCTVAEIESGMIQLEVPVLCAEAVITVTVAKLSFENSSFTFGTVPEVVQVIAWVAPTVQISPPFGELTAKAAMILKFASETSLTVESAASATRTLTVAEMSLGTVQVYEPVFAVEAAIKVAVAKLSFEYSSLTLGIVPVVVQVIVRLSPTVQTSPPFGAVRVKAPRILKFVFEVAKASELLTSLTLTRTVVEMLFGTVQENVPVLGVEAAMTTVSLKVPFLEYSSFTLAIEPVFVQVMFWTVLTPHFSPPLGAVTVREPTILKFASEVSTTVTSAVLVTRTLTVELILSGTVHAYVPAAASVDAVISEAVANLPVD